MVHFNAFNDHLDASAVLLLLSGVPVFSSALQAAASSVRNERNDWAHCVFSNWNQAKFQHSFDEMKHLVKAMALPSSVEGEIIGELKDWQNTGKLLCMNSPVDQGLLQLVHQNVHSLENEVKNWCKELKKEKNKVGQQLQIFDLAFKGINQRLLTLETGHERLETEHQRLKSYSRDIEQRVIKCEDEISDLKEKRPHQESHKVVVNPERIVQLTRRDYKSAVLCPFPWCEDELQFKLDRIFTRLQIVSKTTERSRLTDDVVNMTDIFRPHADCKNPRVVLIEGNPAMGKTTFCQKLAHDWSLCQIPADSSFPEVEILLLLKCRDMNVEIANIEQAIDDQLLPNDVDRSEKENFFQFVRANQSRIVLVLDGLDELKNKDLVLPLIQGKVLSNIYLLLTARPEMGAKVRRYCDSLLQIVGYTGDDVNNYIDQYFCNHSDPSLAKKLKDKLAGDDQLKKLTSSPMNTALLCLLCEETNGTFPIKQTELYECLVSCAIRRYFAKRGIDLGEDNLSERYRDQLNHLGKMAFEALLKNRLYFSKEEMRSENVLQLCFVTREPSRSKIKPTECYAFAHKTFQEYFAALYLANQVLMDRKESEALLLNLSPVDNWQVWEFLFPLVAKKDDERAVFLVSCLGTSSRHAIPEAIAETPDYDLFVLGEREEAFSVIVNKALYVIAEWEDCGDVLYDYQKKMLVKLLDCIPVNKLEVRLKNPRHLLAVSECLRASCRLPKLRLYTGNFDLSKLGQVLQYLHKIEHFEFIGYEDNDLNRPVIPVGTFQSIPQSCPLLTHFVIGLVQVSNEDVQVIVDALCTNNALTFLALWVTEIFYLDVTAVANVLQSKCSTLKHLVLGSRRFGAVGLRSLVQALHMNCVLTNLELSKYGLDDEIVVALGEALEFNTTLTHLSLLEVPDTVNQIGWSCVSPLARALKKNSTLKSLTLPFKDFEFRKDSKAEALPDASQTNSAQTQLDVSDICELASQTGAICDALRFTRAQDSEAEALAGARQTDSTLAQSDLSGICELKTEAICKAPRSTQTQDSEAEALADAPQTNSTLTQLDSNVIWALELSEITRFSRTKWHSAAEELADALLTNSTLTYLSLSGICELESEAICKALQSNHAVTDLILYESVIDHPGANALAEALKSPDTQLTYLSLGFCLVNVDVIIEALQTNRSLTHLNLTTLDIPPSATVLAKSLQLNRTLTHLTLSYNRISNTGALLLAQTLLDQNNTLAYLDLSYNKIGDTGKAKLELIDPKICVINLEGQL
ncbi:NLR family CARD domain-containing protein 3-like isoform X2 [Acropora muricata]